MEPRIIERMVVIWLGGHALHWPDTKEFNLLQDMNASKVLLNCGVPLVLVPCLGVSSHLQTTLSEVKDYVRKHGRIGSYLYEAYKSCSSDHYAYTRVLWDIAPIAFLIHSRWTPSSLVRCPSINEDLRGAFHPERHLIRYVLCGSE